MDAKLMVTLLATITATAAVPVPENAVTVAESKLQDGPFVQGVFIPANALKSLQEISQQNAATSSAGEIEKKSEQIDIPPSNEQQNQPQQMDPQQNQNMHPEQNQIGNPQPQMTGQIYSNQPTPNQPSYNQPIVFAQPGYNPGQAILIGSQPYTPNQQAMLLTQQPEQGILVNQLPNGYNQQPTTNQQSGYNQQPINNQQPSMYNPQPSMYNQQPSKYNPQPSMYNPQPSLYNPQPNIYNQQPNINNQQPNGYQPVLVSQPNQALFIPNSQFRPSSPNLTGQQTMVGNNPNSGAILGNPIVNSSPNLGNLYALVPANGLNANPNLSNNNAYFVPIQQ